MGVYHDQGKIYVQHRVGTRRVHEGPFDTEVGAAVAYAQRVTYTRALLDRAASLAKAAGTLASEMPRQVVRNECVDD